MKDGLTGRTDTVSRAWKVKLPPHDYRDAALACLDPDRPQVFQYAMYLLKGDSRLVDLLHRSVDKIKDEEIRESVYYFLWFDHDDPTARDHFFTMLSTKDDAKFNRTVAWLTTSRNQADATTVVPKLSAVLHGDNLERRLIVLERLGNYFAPPGAALAADEVAPFLISQEPKEKNAARKTLLQIQNFRTLNVLQRIAEKASDEKVRGEASQMLKEWNAKHARP